MIKSMESKNNQADNLDSKKIEEEINKRIKKLPRKFINLSYSEKRKIVLEEMNITSKVNDIVECIDLQNNTMILFDIPKIRKARDEYIEKLISEIKDEAMTYEDKLLKVLNELNSSESFEIDNNKEEVKILEPDKIIINKNNLSCSVISDSTLYSSVSSEIPLQHSNLWIENEYYDIIDSSKQKEKNKDEEYLFYQYDNNLNTYNFAISQKLMSVYKLNKISTEGVNKENFKKKYGLYFCGKKIKEFNKKCSPNEMMCKDCMNKNKKIYHLDKHKSAMININGRVSSNDFGDNIYQCFGKFLYKNERKTCAEGKFTCEACQELNKIKNYYLPS